MRDAELSEIRALRLFSGMSDDSFAALIRGAYHQSFPPRVTLIDEGRPADFLHIVTEGAVELFANWSERETTMAVVRPVSTFVLAACINDAPYLMSARTLVPSRIVLIPGANLREIFASDTAFALAIVRELAGCYRSVVRHAKDLKLRTSKERLANYILSQCQLLGGRTEFDLPWEKRLLASYLGMTPENLSRGLRALREDGVLVTGQRVVIADLQRLERSAQATPLIDGSDSDPEPAFAAPPLQARA